MTQTKIEWAEFSWNPITGCSHAGSPGCDHCYARRMARRLAGRCGYPEYPRHFDVTLHPERLEEPLRRKKPTMYFVCSMSDLFHEDVSDEFIVKVFARMTASTEHTFQVLTKRPERMLDFVSEYAPGLARWTNIWLGVTAENQAAADERIPLLLQTPAAVRFVSCEPLLGPVDLELVDADGGPVDFARIWGLHWIICGGESGPDARPMRPQWARGLLEQCQDAGVPFFFKQWGAFRPADFGWKLPEGQQKNEMVRVGKKRAGRLLDGREWNEFPEVAACPTS